MKKIPEIKQNRMIQLLESDEGLTDKQIQERIGVCRSIINQARKQLNSRDGG